MFLTVSDTCDLFFDHAAQKQLLNQSKELQAK